MELPGIHGGIMDKCPRCEKQIDPEDLFCGNCGLNIMAQASFGGATQKELKLSDIQLSLGIVYLKKGEFAKARDIFNKILEVDPENQHATRMMEQIRQIQEARSTLSAAATIN